MSFELDSLNFMVAIIEDLKAMFSSLLVIYLPFSIVPLLSDRKLKYVFG